jgi:hypothetical protein
VSSPKDGPLVDGVCHAEGVLESDDIAEARRLDRAGREIDVLITVKAAPQPSRHYGDTVCVAGIALDPLRWVRLYPVPFRYLDDSQTFRKYDIVRVKVRHPGQDGRRESLKVDAESFRTLRHLDGWKARAPYVEPVIGGSLCELQRNAGADPNGTSLAAIRPTGVIALDVKRHKGWSPEQLARFEEFAAQGDLFRTYEPRMLAAPRLRAALHFDCTSPGCKSHRLSVIDWELNALQARFHALSEHELEGVIRDRFWQMMYNAGKDPALYVGNQENPARRRQFTLLGTYYPPRRTGPVAEGHEVETLF